MRIVYEERFWVYFMGRGKEMRYSFIFFLLVLVSCSKVQDDVSTPVGSEPSIIGSYVGGYSFDCEPLGVHIEGKNSIVIQGIGDGQLLIRTINGIATARLVSDTSYDYMDFEKQFNYCSTTMNLIIAGRSYLKGDSLIEGGSTITFKNGRCEYGTWSCKSVKIK